ncbi:MAG: hypothetical protein MUP85_24425, partial [Candidatus Lokiarchaeota archaeon]|nr:hypothetical protein [Candidatus Lokiarchaeota archaeon]
MCVNKTIKSNFIRRFAKALVDPKIVRYAIIINLFTFIPGLILSVLLANFFGPLGYNILDNFISDLGSITYTPVPFIFDFIIIFGAILTIPAFLYNNKFLMEGTQEIIFNSAEKIWKRLYYLLIDISAILGFFFLLIGSVGMFGIGIFSIDRSPPIHFFFSVFVFAGLIFGALFAGIAILLKKVICPHFLGLYMIIGPFMAGFLFLNPPVSISIQFLEWIMLFAQQIWL